MNRITTHGIGRGGSCIRLIINALGQRSAFVLLLLNFDPNSHLRLVRIADSCVGHSAAQAPPQGNVQSDCLSGPFLDQAFSCLLAQQDAVKAECGNDRP